MPEPVELMQCPDHDTAWKFSDSLLGVAQESYFIHLQLYEILYIEASSMVITATGVTVPVEWLLRPIKPGSVHRDARPGMRLREPAN